MRSLPLIAVLALALPATATAQTPRWALGATLFNTTYFSESGLLDVGIPGGGPLVLTGGLRAAPEIYAVFFPHPQLTVVPGIAFNAFKPEGADTRYGLGLDLAVEWHPSGVTGNSAYAAANFALLAHDFGSGSESDTEFAAGVAIGYRWLPYEFLALRTEAVFRRYLDFEENQLTAVLKAEVVFN
jgi:hypothetical protein